MSTPNRPLNSQFMSRSAASRAVGAPVVVTPTTVPSDGQNLTLSCVRIVYVGDPHRYQLRYPRRGQQYDWLFSVVFAGADGLIDATCYQGSLRDQFVVNYGALVSLHGVTSRPMTAEQLGYAHGLGRNTLGLQLPNFRMEPLPATLEATCGVPAEGRVPTEWIRVHDENSGGRESRSIESTPIRAAMNSQAPETPPRLFPGTDSCCSDPSGPMCRRTGEPHSQICMACRRVIRADEPFCSVRQGLACIPAPREGGMVMTSTLTGATVTTVGMREQSRIPMPSREVATQNGPALSPLLQDTLKRARDGDLSRDGDTEDE